MTEALKVVLKQTLVRREVSPCHSKICKQPILAMSWPKLA